MTRIEVVSRKSPPADGGVRLRDRFCAPALTEMVDALTSRIDSTQALSTASCSVGCPNSLRR